MHTTIANESTTKCRSNTATVQSPDIHINSTSLFPSPHTKEECEASLSAHTIPRVSPSSLSEIIGTPSTSASISTDSADSAFNCTPADTDFYYSTSSIGSADHTVQGPVSSTESSQSENFTTQLSNDSHDTFEVDHAFESLHSDAEHQLAVSTHEVIPPSPPCEQHIAFFQSDSDNYHQQQYYKSEAQYQQHCQLNSAFALSTHYQEHEYGYQPNLPRGNQEFLTTGESSRHQQQIEQPFSTIAALPREIPTYHQQNEQLHDVLCAVIDIPSHHQQQYEPVLPSENPTNYQEWSEQLHRNLSDILDDGDIPRDDLAAQHYLGSLCTDLGDASFPRKGSAARDDAFVPTSICQQSLDSSLPSFWIPPANIPDTSEQQSKPCLSNRFSEALDSAFANSSYNAPPLCGIQQRSPQDYEFSDEIFRQESLLLQKASLLVPLFSSEAAAFSQTDTLKYVPFHVSDPTLDDIPVPLDYQLSSPEFADLNDSSIPEYVRKGVAYDRSELVDL